jgi:hypothetical protein
MFADGLANQGSENGVFMYGRIVFEEMRRGLCLGNVGISKAARETDSRRTLKNRASWVPSKGLLTTIRGGAGSGEAAAWRYEWICKCGASSAPGVNTSY